MRMRKGQNDLVKARLKMATPPTRWLKARNFSAEKFRSANWLLKNIPTMAAMGKAFRIHDCCAGVNPRLGRYPKMSGSHAPQMKNSSTIITNNLTRIGFFIGLG